MTAPPRPPDGPPPAHRPPTTGRIAVAIAIIISLAIVGYVYKVVRDQPSPLGPAPTTTDIAAVVTAQPPTETPPPTAPLATPTSAAHPAVRDGSLRDLLRYAPDRLADNSLPLNDVLQYADLAGWMDCRGVPSASAPSWSQELGALAMPDVLAQRATDAIWRETYGFDLTTVRQVLAVGQAPDYVMILRGDWSADDLQRAWGASGYQPIRRQGYTLWSLSPSDDISLSAPASRPALGTMNNLVLLDDGTLIATSRLSRLNDVISVITGNAPSLATNTRLRALLTDGTSPDDLLTASVLKGSVLARSSATPIADLPALRPVTVRTTAAASPDLPAPMPHGRLVLAGMLRPATPAAAPLFSLVISYDDSTEATVANYEASLMLTAPNASHRILLRGLRVIAAPPNGAVLYLRGRLPDGPADWIAILEDRDLEFIMWPDDR